MAFWLKFKIHTIKQNLNNPAIDFKYDLLRPNLAGAGTDLWAGWCIIGGGGGGSWELDMFENS